MKISLPFGYEIRKKSKYPTDHYYNSILNIGANIAKWLNLESSNELLNAYDEIPDIKILIDKLTNLFIKFKYKHLKKQGSELIDISEDSPLIDKLNNPNAFQGGIEWIKQLYTYWQVFGNCVTIGNWPVSGTEGDYNRIETLYNLPFDKLKFELNQNFFQFEDIRDILKFVKLNIDNEIKENYIPDEIMHINDVNIKWDKKTGYFLGKSKLSAQRDSVTNLGIGYEMKNVIWYKRGALGILSPDGKSEYSMPLLDDDRKDLQRQFQENYGITYEKFQYIITKSPLKFVQMGGRLRELMLYEGLEDDRKLLCAAYSFPFLLYMQDDSSTFSNFDIATQNAYQDKIIPDWILYQNALNNFFKLKEKNEKIIIDYSDISVLQEDQKELIEKQILESDGITKLLLKYNSGEISREQAEIVLSTTWKKDESEIEILLDFAINTENNNDDE